jgi:hypothetical protein
MQLAFKVLAMKSNITPSRFFTMKVQDEDCRFDLASRAFRENPH